jgi:hypothetical protein
MSGHGAKNHGRKWSCAECNLYFEVRNFCGTVFNSNNPTKWKKKGRIPNIKPIVEHKYFGRPPYSTEAFGEISLERCYALEGGRSSISGI